MIDYVILTSADMEVIEFALAQHVEEIDFSEFFIDDDES